MLERCKTLLLLVLIAICIRFTGLYFARVHASTPLFIAAGEAPPPAELPEQVIPESYIDLFSPHYILVHNRGQHYRLSANENEYARLWEALKGAIDTVKNWNESTTPELQAVPLNEWQHQIAYSYEYRFAGPAQLHYWWLTASKATMQKFPEGIYFNRLLIPLNSNSFYLQNTYTGERWKWQWSTEANRALFPTPDGLDLSETQRVREVKLASGLNGVPGSQIYAPANTIELPEVLATPPITDSNKDAIVKRFFSILPRMHKTETPGGGRVVETYITARQQVLTLHNSGLLTYSEIPAQLAPDAPSGTTVEQFEQVFNFVLGRGGGWPKGTIAAGMEPIAADDRTGYRFDFMQLYNGLPVLDFEPTLTIEVVPGGVRNYQRLCYNIIQPGYFQFEVRSIESALDRAQTALAGRRISDIYLAYYQRPAFLTEAAPFHSEPMYLYPVWAIELENGERLYVHAYKLLNDPGLIQRP